MKIVIINNGLAGGGIERASVSLANFWAEQGHEINLIALYQSEHFFSVDSGGTFTEPSFPYAGNKIVYTLRMMRYLRRHVLQAKPDTILAYGENSNPYVLLALSRCRIPVFVSDRMHPKARLSRLTFWLKRQLYPKATGIIAQTNFAKQVMLGYLKGGSIHVIPNPVNAIDTVEVERKPQIVAVGRLEEVKGHEYLIRAFARLNKPDWSLSIVGDGSLMPFLKDLAQQLGIDHNVTFHGHLKDFRTQLSEASIFVLPSLKEGFPNALLEAMSVPLPCITTNFMGDNNEIIQEGNNGMIVAAGDASAMADALNLLIDSPELRARMSGNAFKVREDYAFHRIALRYFNVINAIDAH